jgi:hypothetical protein
VAEAEVILASIRALAPEAADPWADAATLTRAIRTGILDAPHFRGNPRLCGRVVTACVDGGQEAVDPATRRPIPERERIAALGPAVE